MLPTNVQLKFRRSEPSRNTTFGGAAGVAAGMVCVAVIVGVTSSLSSAASGRFAAIFGICPAGLQPSGGVVPVELIEDDTGWSPYLSIEDAKKLDAVRQALREGKIAEAAKHGRVFELTPVAAK